MTAADTQRLSCDKLWGRHAKHHGPPKEGQTLCPHLVVTAMTGGYAEGIGIEVCLEGHVAPEIGEDVVA